MDYIIYASPSGQLAGSTLFAFCGGNNAALSISNVHVTQTVPDFQLQGHSENFDLVQGKTTTIQFDLSTPQSNLNDSTPVNLSVTLNDGSTMPAPSPNGLTIGQIASAPNGTLQVVIAGFVPQNSGSFQLDIQATAGSNQVSFQPSPSVVVKQTKLPSIAYVPVNGQAGCSAGPTGTSCLMPLKYDPAEHQKQSDNFAEEVFPIANNVGKSTLVQPSSPLIGGQAPSTFCQSLGPSSTSSDAITACDFLNVWMAGVLSPANATNYVGIVPLNYTNYIQAPKKFAGVTPVFLDAAGNIDSIKTANSFFKVSLVTEGEWEITAHEVAHTYGVPDAPAGNVPELLPDLLGNLQIGTNLDLMGTSTCSEGIVPNTVDITTCDTFRNLTSRWISSPAFGQVFKATLVNPADPQVLLIAATVSQNGTVGLFPTRFLESGYPTQSVPNGSSSVSVLDSTGAVISQTNFDLPNGLLGPSGGPVPLNTSFFLVSIPFSSNAASIQITRSGAVLATFDPNSRLLVDAINAIPAADFKRNAIKERKILVDAATRIEHTLQICQSLAKDPDHDGDTIGCSSRVVRQLLDLRESVENELISSKIISSPQEQTKADLLSLVDMLTLNVIPNRKVRARHHAFEIRVIPLGDDHDDDARFTITSVTQGVLGSVYIDRGGVVTYKPNGKVGADKFTVTIKDPEGAKAVKQITIVAPKTAVDPDEKIELFSGIEKIMAHKGGK